MTKTVGAAALYGMLQDGGEIAVVDVREEQAFSQSHLLYAISVPLSHLELKLADLVPRPDTRVVLCDAGEGLAERGAERLAALGYGDVAVLEGGIAAWASAGYELYSGFNVPSKAFGEFVEHHFGTPSVSAEELKAMLDSGRKMVVLDSRPIDEFHVMNIPTGTCCPGGELVWRAHEIAPDPETTIVVNCAGRTRSIIGAQSLINAGIPNKVVALRNGTMGWHLAGLELERGNRRLAPDVGEEAARVARARGAAVAKRFDVQTVGMDQVEAWRRDRSRTTFLLDVRSPPEYEAGHLPGSISAPGGQLVQATDRYAGVRGARLVLVDDTLVRATMTAHWLLQMNWDVHVLESGLPKDGLETGPRAPTLLGADALADVGTVSPGELKAMLDSDQPVIVIDLGVSRDYRKGHVPGAYFAVRARLAGAIARIAERGMFVVTSEDGTLARYGAADLARLTDMPVRALAGGTRAWAAAGLPLAEGEERMADTPDDVWLKPYERKGTIEDFMNEYLSWEIDLVHQIERDGLVSFRSF